MTDTLSLNGTWDILFDHDNQGRQKEWHREAAFSAAAGRRTLEVPSCWEESERDYEGVAYYRRRFRVPPEWTGRTVRLHFDAVNFASEVWLNDQAVGFHEGGFTPFEFRLEQMLKPGEENTLIVRVAGPILLQDKRIEGIGPMETPQWRGAITGGIWQPAWLVATGEAYVRDVFVEPQIADDSVSLHLEVVHNASKGRQAELSVTVRAQGGSGEVAAQMDKAVQLAPGANRWTERLQLPKARYWSVADPHLYKAEIVVSLAGQESHRWSTRFGLRQFTVREGKFCLNGEPLFLKATFFEGLYPVKLAYPDTREMAVREIQLAKDAGFNMIRPWRKPPPPAWLDLADELGVLTVGSLAIECMEFPVESARLPRWVENEVRESILRDRNRACVVQWELFNEICRPVLAQRLHPMAMLARELDPTRMILDESGGWAQGANLYLPYQREPTKFNDVHCYPGPQLNDNEYTKLQLAGNTSEETMRAKGLSGPLPGRNVIPGLPTYFSELGYGSLPDLVDNNQRFEQRGNPLVPPTVYHRRLAEEHQRALKESGFDSVYPDLRQFCLDQQRIHGQANRRMIEAVRCNPAVVGYCIHALTAGDWILGAGLLDLWRNPKTDAYHQTKAANAPRLLTIRVQPRNLYADRGARIQVMGVNNLAAVAGKLTVEVRSAAGEVVLTRTVSGPLASGITPLFEEPLNAAALRGHYLVRASFDAGNGAAVGEAAGEFDVFAAEDLTPPAATVAVFDPSGSLKPFLLQAGVEVVDFDQAADSQLPVLVSHSRATEANQEQQFTNLAAFAEGGGTVVYLGGIGHGPTGWLGATPIESPVPVEGFVRRAVGAWTCMPHVVREHPVFCGLPTNCMMGSLYENVWAENTLEGLGGEAIVGAFGYDWYPDGDKRKRHYYGPGDTWWGADLAVVPHGNGRLIISQLRLLENLGKDPVADRLLFNLIDFACRG